MTIADLGAAFALMLVIEGALYALFPDLMRRAMSEVLSMPVQQLRVAALATAALGVALLWLVRG